MYLYNIIYVHSSPSYVDNSPNLAGLTRFKLMILSLRFIHCYVYKALRITSSMNASSIAYISTEKSEIIELHIHIIRSNVMLFLVRLNERSFR